MWNTPTAITSSTTRTFSTTTTVSNRAAFFGVMEFMVAELCHAAPKLGVRRISLNFAVFRSVFEEGARIGAGPVLRLWRRLLLFFSKWWQLEALYRSNAKYHPEWYPRFLCYAEAASLARVGLASGIAEGFVSVPSMRTLWGRGRGHSKGGQRPATTEGLPSLAALGLAGGDGTEPADPLAALPDQVRIRHRKLDRLRAGGTDPYPVGVPAPTHSLAGIEQGQDVTVAGRIMLVRDFRRHRLRHAARPVRRPPARPHP
jgi:lysyl-tRNA synthetase class 2